MFPSATSGFCSLRGMISDTQSHSGNAFDINCKECRSRFFDTQWLECLCRDGARQWKYTTLDLSKSGSSFGCHSFRPLVGSGILTRLGLDEGIRYDQDAHVLACFDHLGVRNSPKA
jgi:hypothetical protein